MPTPCVTRPSCSPTSWARGSWHLNGACTTCNGGEQQRRLQPYARSVKQSFCRFRGRTKAAVEGRQCMARAAARPCHSGAVTGQATGSALVLRREHEVYRAVHSTYRPSRNGMPRNAKIGRKASTLSREEHLREKTQTNKCMRNASRTYRSRLAMHVRETLNKLSPLPS